MSTSSSSFLAERLGRRPWPQLPAGGRGKFEPAFFFLGRGSNPLEVRVARASSRPNVSDVRTLWERTQARRPSPLLLIVLFPTRDGERAIACGPAGDKPPVTPPLDAGQLERVAQAALDEPNRNSAIRLLNASLEDVQHDLPGVRNVGMFATHELRVGVPLRPDWGQACEQSQAKLMRRGRDLVEALGFTIEQLGTGASILRAEGTATAVAVFLEDYETPDSPAPRFAGLSPVSHALAAADADRLPYVVVTRGPEIRLYASDPDVGVGRKGRAETFVAANLTLLPGDRAGYLDLLFGASALTEGGSFGEILDRSRDFSADLGRRLRERVYQDVVPVIATAIASRHEVADEVTETELNAFYQQALLLLFRLLFVAYAEDKDVLPYRRNGLYANSSLKTLARELADRANEGEVTFDPEATDLWGRVISLFRAVNLGHKEWGVPPYDGGLFSSEHGVHEWGAELAEIELSNDELGSALLALLVDVGEGGVYGPVDFRSLSVREFGTIYEGLLESNLALAETDLTTDKNGTYVPAKKGQEVIVPSGHFYLHNRSGARKSSGSYFTKPFAVEHLLDYALERALDDHVARLRSLVSEEKDIDAAEAFFDFRCADIAMGSGHFLVASVDRIERRLSAFLAEHPLPHVLKELEALRVAAYDHLGPLGEGVDIEHASLLRRLIGRRCIYGVDLNPIAVELARLAIWIHTFVPGLPLSFLDHNLVAGNSLTGIGAVEEAERILDAATDPETGRYSIFHEQIVEWLERAKEHLQRLGRVSEASVAEVKESRADHMKALEAVRPARELFDLLLAIRLGEAQPLVDVSDERIAKHPKLDAARELANDELEALHFPVAFPEVFLRERAGFDCILGNPPWEKLQLEEHSFYALSFPGLRGLSQSEAEKVIARIRRDSPDLVAEYERGTKRIQRLKEALAAGPYPGMTAGRPDLYKAFAWRFAQVARSRGYVGVVLPRKAVEASGMKKWRQLMLEAADFVDVTMLVNRRQWVFPDVHPQYTVGLLSLRMGANHERKLRIRGPFASSAAYQAGMATPPVEFSAADLLSWSDSATLPLLPSIEALAVFSKIRRFPPLAQPEPGWAPRGMRELNASDDKEHFRFVSSGEGLWPVYKGESFDIWEPDTGLVYAYAEPQHITDFLQRRRLNQIRIRRSSFYAKDAKWARDPETLPARHPRVAWRDSSRATDSRTVRTALIPPNTVLVHQAYTLFWIEGGPRDEAYVLGVLSSIPFDWYARQLVESHVTVEFMNSSPVPRPAPDSPLRQRVVYLAGRMAAIDSRFEAWAKAVGVPVGSVSTDERPDLVAELDAVVGLLFELDETDLEHIYRTFHPTWDHAAPLEAVQQHFRSWKARR